MDDNGSAEFEEDFGDSLQSADLECLLTRARTSGDRELRLPIKQHQTLRRVAADALAFVEEQAPGRCELEPAPGKPTSYPIGFLRELLRDEPRTPSN